MSDNTDNMTTTPAVADRSEEFVPVQGGQETSSATGLLTAAYILMWMVVFVFIWLTSRRLRGVQVRVMELEVALRKADAESAERTKNRAEP